MGRGVAVTSILVVEEEAHSVRTTHVTTRAAVDRVEGPLTSLVTTTTHKGTTTVVTHARQRTQTRRQTRRRRAFEDAAAAELPTAQRCAALARGLARGLEVGVMVPPKRCIGGRRRW